MKRLFTAMMCATFLLGQPLASLAADDVTCWFPPSWKNKTDKAKSITDALSKGSGITVNPRIAKSYPQILASFDSADYSLVYVGSFVQAIINARSLGTPLAQSVNGKEMYSGILVYPKGQDPKAILSGSPDMIAFALGASSGESSAKAATGGKATLGVANHMAACRAVKAGKAKAAVVKNWWWDGNKGEFPDFESYQIPGVSEKKNPDNVLTASRSLPADMAGKIKEAAMGSKDVFGATEMSSFDPATLEFSLGLMKAGRIDPLTYSW
jgi:ABC-type phosphate/phosphonate transport system substrate-binding protein